MGNEIEKEYLEKNSPYKMEQIILNSFSKKELKTFINGVQHDYLKQRLPYITILSNRKKNKDYINGNELDKCFIEMLFFYFEGGFEIEMTKQFLNKLNMFYKMNHIKFKNKNFKKIDIRSIPVVEIIQMYMKIGNNLNRNHICPLHKEKTGSFRIYKNTNSWFCFGCKKGGGIIEFISEIEKISKKEAFKKVCSLYAK